MKRNCIIALIVFSLVIAGMAFTTLYRTLAIDNKDYQLYMDLDSVRIYDSNRLLDVIPYGRDGIDSVILADNL